MTETTAATAEQAVRVIVIGAGFAGLSAAHQLRIHAPESINVTVLEAGPVVGGRARAGKLPSGTNVELGATWFHGVRDNPVYDMAVWQGVVKDVRADPEAQKHDIDWQLHFARPHEGQLLGGELGTLALEAVGRYSEAAEECIQSAQAGDATVGDILRRTFDEAVAAEKLGGEALQVFADAWQFREKLQRTFDGFYSTDDVSLAFAREYETLDGPNLPVPGGYQALAEILAQGLDVRLHHRVARITYGPSGARVACTNGATFDADVVLVTTSLGVLQSQHQTLFDPPLPDWKLEAMKGVHIGVADKLFLEFEIDPAHTLDAATWLTTHATTAVAQTKDKDPGGPASGSFPLPGAWQSGGASSARHPSRAQPGPPTQQGPQPMEVVGGTSPNQPITAHMSEGGSVGGGGAGPQVAGSSSALAQQQQGITYPNSPLLGQPSPSSSSSPMHSSASLPEIVTSALPPQAAGGQPEPWNIGRRGVVHDQGAGHQGSAAVDGSAGGGSNQVTPAGSTAGNVVSAPAADGEQFGGFLLHNDYAASHRQQKQRVDGSAVRSINDSGISAATSHLNISDGVSQGDGSVKQQPAPPFQPMLTPLEEDNSASFMLDHVSPQHLSKAAAPAADGAAATAVAPSENRSAGTGAMPGVVHQNSGNLAVAGVVHQNSGTLQLGTAAGQRPRRRKHRRAIHSYAFLWPVADPSLQGVAGHPALIQSHYAAGGQLYASLLGGQGSGTNPVHALPVPSTTLYSLPALPLAKLLPSWSLGLHSLRYCPGPEWIQPSLLQEMEGSQGNNSKAVSRANTGLSTGTAAVLQAGSEGGRSPQHPLGAGGASSTAANGGGGSGGSLSAKRGVRAMTSGTPPAVNPRDGGATHVSGVLWITGTEALAMEGATEAEVVAGVETLFKMFPQVPLPPGAKMPPRVVRTHWGTDDLFCGSYSYIGVGEDSGDCVDALAEPLVNDAGMPIIMFAGEATHRQYIGTVHGAFLSGCREAERLIRALEASIYDSR